MYLLTLNLVWNAMLFEPIAMQYVSNAMQVRCLPKFDTTAWPELIE